jgi:hypothetical protein
LIFEILNLKEQLSDIFMAISVAANCLMHGSELPAHLPNLRDRLVYHAHKRGLSAAKSNKQVGDVHDEIDMKERGEMSQPEDVHDSSTGIEADELDLDVLLVNLFLVGVFSSLISSFTRTNTCLHMPPP